MGRGPSFSSSHGGQSTNSSSRPTTNSGVYHPAGAGYVNGANAKEQEAFGSTTLAPRPVAGLGLGVTNPDLGEASASTVVVDREAYLRNGPGPGPIVHRDAGRVDPVDEGEAVREEIPPTYDSLPVDERR